MDGSRSMTRGVDAERHKHAARMFASGVTVVTAELDGAVHGLTASTFVSLSIDPPQVLVCIGRRASLHRVLERAESFAVNVLREGQRHISEHFATPGRTPGPRFPGIPFRAGRTGSPLIEGGLAYFDCRIAERVPAADHTIFIGSVVDAGADDAGHPLVYFNRAYCAVRDLDG